MSGGTLHPIAPPGIISDKNQSGLILILTALALNFILISFAVRVYVRHPKGLWKLDDNVLAAATILSCINSAIVFQGVHMGMGNVIYMDQNGHTHPDVRKLYYANHFLYIVVLLLSKAAVGGLYLRLTRYREHRIATWIIIAACIAWGLMSVLMLSIDRSWHSALQTCFTRWLAIAIVDCITELALVLMSVYLVKDLRLSMSQKTTVVSAFAARLFTILPCIVRLYYLNPSILPENRNMAISLSIVCGQIQIAYAIVAASVAVLKPFMAVYEKTDQYTNSYATGPSAAAAHAYYPNHGKDSGSGGGSGENSIALSSMPSRPDQRGSNADFVDSRLGNYTADDGADLEARNHRLKRKTTRLSTLSSNVSPSTAFVDRGSGFFSSPRNILARSRTASLMKPVLSRRQSAHSHDSRRMIIERSVDWSVRYEECAEHERCERACDREIWERMDIGKGIEQVANSK